MFRKLKISFNSIIFRFRWLSCSRYSTIFSIFEKFNQFFLIVPIFRFEESFRHLFFQYQKNYLIKLLFLDLADFLILKIPKFLRFSTIWTYFQILRNSLKKLYLIFIFLHFADFLVLKIPKFSWFLTILT